MSAPATADFLVEIGTEELPPTALKTLMLAFAAGLEVQLDETHLAHGAVTAFASPRRLAVRVDALALAQSDQEVEQKGPPVRIAFAEDGTPTQAAKAFAEKCGVAVNELTREETPKGEWLVYRGIEHGRAAAELLPQCVQRALDGLPIPRRMRWGAGTAEFVRPVHWLVMLHGDQVVPAEVLGMKAGRVSAAHRFMGDGPIELASPADYPAKLLTDGHVIADFVERRRRIVTLVTESAAAAGGTAVAGDELLDEVTALTEWPVAVTGGFDEAFLALPKEVIVSTLTGHQRYFPVVGKDGNLLPVFITLANIASSDPDKVRDGNERVIRPRLADAAFFWEADRKATLEARGELLKNVVYQHGLGTVAERCDRVAALAIQVAAQLNVDADASRRAALLAKCDLVTGMVGEFPELQGTMGRYYALADGEPLAVADAIAEHYLPRFAGDELPASDCGRALAIADKLDTLCGIFGSGKKPSGNRDPFGLRRAALGVVRIIVELKLELDLPALIAASLKVQPVAADPAVGGEVYDFIVERLRGWYTEQDLYGGEMFESVRWQRLPSLTDVDARLQAVAEFVENPSAESLAAANKRIANILRKADFDGSTALDPALFIEVAERELYDALQAARNSVADLLAARRYGDVLGRLAELRAPVDRFFDDVMVMSDDDKVRNNRLSLLAGLRAQFLDVADISRLSLAKG
ncbi:MAG: glycine--tRNA ligase subunit beta [Woeseia sp.]